MEVQEDLRNQKQTVSKKKMGGRAGFPEMFLHQ